MENDDRLGDKIVTSEIEPGALPHPEDPWGTSSSVDTALGAVPSPSAPASVPTTKEVTPAKGIRPIPTASKATRTESAVISRFREVFGLSRIKVVPIEILRIDPNDENKNVSMTFGVRGVNYEDYQWILEHTQRMQQNPILATFAWKISFVSMALASIEGEPVWKALGFEPLSPESIRDEFYPPMGLRFQAADAVCDLFKDALFDLVEEVYSLYEKKVDSRYLARKGATVSKGEDKSGPLAPSGSGS